MLSVFTPSGSQLQPPSTKALFTGLHVEEGNRGQSETNDPAFFHSLLSFASLY